MTVSNTASSTKVYGNGAQTAFNYGFEIPTGAGYALYLEDSAGNITTVAPSAFSVSGVGNSSGGTFTYPLTGSPLAAGNSLTFVRVTPNQQQTALGNQSAYYPQVVEAALDWLELQIQELKNTLGLAIQAPPVDGSIQALPSAPLRANGYLAFDGSGNPMVAAGVTQGTVNVSTAMVPVVEAATVPDAAALLGLSAAMTPVTDAASINAGVAELGLAVILADMAALVAATSTTLPGSYAYIAGYYSAGDGGAGLFRYVASDTTSPSNGGTIVVDASARRWYLVWDGERTDIRAWGAKVDGATDDSAPVQAAINFLENGTANLGGAGGAVFFPPGTTLLNAGVTISTGGITLQGVGWEEYKGLQGSLTPGEIGNHGSFILTTSTAASPITIDATVNHSAIRDLAFSQTQPADASGWTPTVYPATINLVGNASSGGAVLMERLFCWNCYSFIVVGGVGLPVGRATMKHIWGMPLAHGITIQYSDDTCQIDDVHFWQFDQNVPNIISWIQANGIGLKSVRNDNPFISNFFAYGYTVGIQITGSTDGTTAKFHGVNIDLDSCNVGVQFLSCSGPVAQIVNLTHQCPTSATSSQSSIDVDGTATGAKVDVCNLRGSSVGAYVITVDGSSEVSVTNFWADNWNVSNGGYPAVAVVSGSTCTLSGAVRQNGGNSAALSGGSGTFINWSGTTTANVTGSRALSGTYTNNTGKPMTVSVTVLAAASGAGNLSGTVGGTAVAISTAPNNGYAAVTFEVPDGDTYGAIFGGTGTLNIWQETY